MLAASRNRAGALLPRLRAKVIWACNRSRRARCSSSSGPMAAVERSSSALSGAAASNLACAAASARAPRRTGSGVNSVARVRNAAAAASYAGQVAGGDGDRVELVVEHVAQERRHARSPFGSTTALRRAAVD